MSDLSKKMRSLFDTWPRALPYAVNNSDDVGLHEQAAAAAILNRHRATPRQDLLALCAEIEALEKENAEMRAELETLRRGPTVDPDPIDEDFEDQLRKCAD